MKIEISLAFLLILLIVACSPSAEQQRQEIEALENSTGLEPSPEQSQQLLDKYAAYITAHPEDKEHNLEYETQSVRLLLHQNQVADGSNKIKTVLETYPEQGYSAIVEMLQNTRKTMFNDSTGRISIPMANTFVNAVEALANLQPKAEQTPLLLHQAGETARSIRNYDKALAIYDQIYQGYPEYEKAPQALFLKAFTLDNDLKRHEEARALYEEFLTRYPEDDFADDTQFLLENLGKDDEEIIQSFQKKEVQ